jgi:hypothetical protein
LNDKRAHFGLGSDTIAKAIEIHWPSGISQRLENIAADQILKVDEPARATGARDEMGCPRHNSSIDRGAIHPLLWF